MGIINDYLLRDSDDFLAIAAGFPRLNKLALKLETDLDGIERVGEKDGHGGCKGRDGKVLELSQFLLDGDLALLATAGQGWFAVTVGQVLKVVGGIGATQQRGTLCCERIHSLASWVEVEWRGEGRKG